MKKLLAFMCIVCLGFVFTVGCGDKDKKDKKDNKDKVEKKDTPKDDVKKDDVKKDTK